MTSRERIKTLLDKKIPDRMGLFEHFWPETLYQRWPKEGYPEGGDPQVVFDYDMRGCGGWFNSEPFMGRSEVVEETDEWRVTLDGRGASLKLWKEKSGTPEHVGFDCTTPEAWGKYRERLLDTSMERLGDLQALKSTIQGVKAEGRYSFLGNIFVFELMRASMGDENFLPALLLEPDWIRDFCSVYLDFYKRHYEIVFREAGVPDGFFLYEDFGFTNGLFCSPKVMADLVMPFEKELVGFFKDYGMQVILHSCGDIREAIPLIIDAGFDCLQPMEAKAGCHVVEIARTYGNKLCYMGNMDVVALGTNDKKTVEGEIVPKLNALREMRIPYVYHSDHSIPPDISLETYKYGLELLRENGGY